MTQRASWIDRAASSSTSLLEPRTSTDTVLPGFAMPVICSTRSHTHTLHRTHSFFLSFSVAFIDFFCMVTEPVTFQTYSIMEFNYIQYNKISMRPTMNAMIFRSQNKKNKFYAVPKD